MFACSDGTGTEPGDTDEPSGGGTDGTSMTPIDPTIDQTPDSEGLDSTSGDATMGEESDDSDDSGTGGEDGPTADDGTVVECPEHPLAPAAEGTCSVDSTGTSGLLLRGTILSPGGVLRAGQVLVGGDGRIACVDCDCSGAAGFDAASQITCGEGVISPGLINPHDHITYANNEPIGMGVERYEHRHDWRTGANGHEALPYNSGAPANTVRAAELRFVMGGATSAASAGGQQGLLRNLDSGGQSLGLPIGVANSDTFPLDDANGLQLSNGCNYGDDPTTNADISDVSSYLPHIAEGINSAALNEFVCTSQGSTDLIEPQTAVIHGIGLEAEDYEIMREEGTMLVWSPRSNVVLYGNTASVTAMDAMGVSITLGTDWVPSGSIDLLRELACADMLNRDYYDGHFSDRDLWKMVTTNAAFALAADDAIGRLAPGLYADIAVFRTTPRAQDHRAVIEAHPEDVALVLRAGEPLYGDAALVTSDAIGGADCEPMNVCEVDKVACVSRDLDGAATLADLQESIAEWYPLSYCGEPDDEPSCVPYRPDDYPSGITRNDGDGDGIDDDMDNCPSVFNPIRWLEQDQGDADQDQAGDACDPCPLDDRDTCGFPWADDFDDDGVENGIDVCPYLADRDQADRDGDGHGDACDACEQANPGASACATTIMAIRDPDHPAHPRAGAQVSVSGVWVTGVRPDSGNSRGFHIQDDSLAPFGGILVFTGSAPAEVQVGNRVTVTGIYEEYFGMSEITNVTVLVEDAGTELPFEPIAVDAAEIATGGELAEPYESMLLSVVGVEISDINPDDPEDYDEFEVTGALRIDDRLSDSVTDAGLGNGCPAGSGFFEIAGVLAFAFDDTKLQPRDTDDVVEIDCDPFVP
jgi:hypothetical protein